MALSPLTSILHLWPPFCSLTYANPNTPTGPLDGDHYRTSSEAAWGIPPKGGDSVERTTKLLQALAKLIAAIAELLRLFKTR